MNLSAFTFVTAFSSNIILLANWVLLTSLFAA